MKEFEDWEVATNKPWTALKACIHGAFQHCLMAVGIHSTSAQHGYAPANNYSLLANKFVDSDNDTIVKQTAAEVTAGSILGNTYTTPALTAPSTNNNLTLTINSLAVNQQALYQHIAPLSQQMAVMSFHAQPSLQARVFPLPNTTPYYARLFSSIPSRAHPRQASTVHQRSLMTASTQDAVGVVMGAVGANMAGMAVAEPHLQTTWLPEAAGFRVLTGETFQNVSGAQYPVQRMNPSHLNVTKNIATGTFAICVDLT
jgi:hypothetical protein